MQVFEKIANDIGCGKLAHGSYMDAYWRHLSHFRGKPVKLLEMGVSHGDSLHMFQKWFPKAEIWGIDIDVLCGEFVPEHKDRIRIGSQGDKEFMESFIEESGGGFDIIVDDAGHEMIPQQTALKILWPELNPCGVYVIEDLETCYGINDPEITKTTDLISKLHDSLHRGYHNNELFLDNLREIHSYANCCFLVKE